MVININTKTNKYNYENSIIERFTKSERRKKGATSLRKEGRIPSVVYIDKDQIHFSILENEAKKLVFTPNVYLIELDIGVKNLSNFTGNPNSSSY